MFTSLVSKLSRKGKHNPISSLCSSQRITSPQTELLVPLFTLVLSTSSHETYDSSSFILYFGPIIFVQKPACTVCVFPHCFPLQICQLLSHHMKLPSLKYFKKQFCEDPNIQFSTSQPSVSPQYLFFPLK